MKRLFALLLVFTMFVFLVGCSEEGATDNEALISTEDNIDKTQIVVYEDDTLIATYTGLSNVVGQIGISFSLENKSNQEVMVLPLNSSINDVMVQFVSGVPATIQPGMVFNQVWMANPQVVGISDSSEVTEIELSLYFGDTETDIITIIP